MEYTIIPAEPGYKLLRLEIIHLDEGGRDARIAGATPVIAFRVPTSGTAALVMPIGHAYEPEVLCIGAFGLEMPGGEVFCFANTKTFADAEDWEASWFGDAAKPAEAA
jgi:hypothetical protein